MSLLSCAFQVTKEEIDKHLDGLENDELVPYHIYLMIDQAYHHTDSDYRGGLSFFHRINNKLRKYDERTLDMLENFVQDDHDQVHMLIALFTEEDLAVQGI